MRGLPRAVRFPARFTPLRHTAGYGSVQPGTGTFGGHERSNRSQPTSGHDARNGIIRLFGTENITRTRDTSKKKKMQITQMTVAKYTSVSEANFRRNFAVKYS